MDHDMAHIKFTEYQRELASLIDRLVESDGTHSTAIPSLHLVRESNVTGPLHTVYEPSLCVIAQGKKMAILGKERYPFDETSYLVASVHLPISGHIIKATSEKPFLCAQLSFNPDEILDIIKNSNQLWNDKEVSERGIVINKSDHHFLNSVLRLIQLLETPEHIPTLAPLIIREILYRILIGEQGNLIKQFALTGSHAYRIAKVIQLINLDLSKSLRIEELAKEVNMSPSSLHNHFKKVTAMSPLQYQKHLRLHEARRLLLSETIEAADAGFQVGYESPSQFSREYAKMFGLPPIRDIKKFRDL